MNLQFRISLRLLGIILGVLRLEVSVYNVYTVSNRFCSRVGAGGVKSVTRKTLKTFVPITSKSSASGHVVFELPSLKGLGHEIKFKYLTKPHSSGSKLKPLLAGLLTLKVSF
jgi:hypothetical protein